MYNVGIVEEIDRDTHRVRVRFPARDNVLSPWLEVLVQSAHGTVVEWLPEAGNSVAVLLDPSESAGCVLGALHSKVDPPRAKRAGARVEFSDGAVIEYDLGAQVFRITPASGGTIELAGNAQHVALAELVKGELQKIRDEMDAGAQHASTHVHPVTALGSPTGPAAAPYTPSYSPSDVASAQVKSA